MSDRIFVRTCPKCQRLCQTNDQTGKSLCERCTAKRPPAPPEPPPAPAVYPDDEPELAPAPAPENQPAAFMSGVEVTLPASEPVDAGTDDKKKSAKR